MPAACGLTTIDLNSPALRAEQVAWLKNRIVAVNETRGVTLTDNFNPLEQLQTRKAEYYRRVIVDWYGAICWFVEHSAIRMPPAEALASSILWGVNVVAG